MSELVIAELHRDGECIARGGVSGYPGEIVAELPSLLDRRGTTGVGALQRRAEMVEAMLAVKE